ncbi:MAG: aminotransferase class I/II-fold pyridoxal phosphate-dependent enzyme [Fibrobacteria bacterium]|nr:aminotransferase class I/II-fold pyridoxal phosphate-dependent enzyme [Fibrobacteria bacterium]
MDTDFERWREAWGARVERLKAQDRHRTLGWSDNAPFCHNDYLGLRQDTRLKEGLRRALDAGLPTTSSGSRLLSGNLGLFQEFEQSFAQAVGMPSGLVFASASEANRVGIGALVGRRDLVLHDELAHASLVDGALQSGAHRRRFRHNDPGDLRDRLAESSGGGIRLVVTESVFSMDGDLAPLEEIAEVCEEFGALLMVDEAHAVGLFGRRRTGLTESMRRRASLIATTHGFGKALASSGGMLCTHAEVLDAIVNTSRAFIFTTAPSPLAIEVARLAWGIAQRDVYRQERLTQLVEMMAEGLRGLGKLAPGAGRSPIFPIHCGGLAQARALGEEFEDMGIPLRPIRPPTVPAGTERLRATVSADLEPNLIRHFLEVLRGR